MFCLSVPAGTIKLRSLTGKSKNMMFWESGCVMNFIEEAKDIFPAVRAFRRYIHENAETGFDLPLTKKAITERLDGMGVFWEEIGGGIVAVVGTGRKNILLRSEMDALPMFEDNQLPFRSKVQRAHMCGHDMNAAMLMGTITLLKRHESELGGQLVALFQPNEEGTVPGGPSGAEEVVKSGFLDKYPVRKGFHFHLNAKSPLNYLNYGKGRTFGASTSFQIRLIGKSAHGSRSYEGKDPMNAAVHLYNILYSIVNREVDVFKHTIFYILPMSASTVNMIPDEMIMNCRLLAYDDEVTPYLMERFKEAASGVAGAFRMQHEFRRISYVPGIEATPEWTDRLLKSAVKILPAGRINTEPEVKRGAEDFSFIGNRLKERTCFFLGAGPDEETAYEYGQHSSKVIFNENTLPVGIALESTMVFDYLNSDEE